MSDEDFTTDLGCVPFNAACPHAGKTTTIQAKTRCNKTVDRSKAEGKLNSAKVKYVDAKVPRPHVMVDVREELVPAQKIKKSRTSIASKASHADRS
jgi:hypothetical protein